MIPDSFFDRDACLVARELLGAVLRRRWGNDLLAVRVVETEAYYRDDRASHAWLGRTPSREPTFQAPGTLYLYHSRAGASLNVSARGAGNAVLIKAAAPHPDGGSAGALDAMVRLNPGPRGPRPAFRLASGQALLCRALALRVADWNGRHFEPGVLWLESAPRMGDFWRTTRLGIRTGRDEHLPYRFVDAAEARSATVDPARRPGAVLFAASSAVDARAASATGSSAADPRAASRAGSPAADPGAAQVSE